MSELIFVTGASGYLGSHVIDQLLKSGYRIRAAARGRKVELLKSIYSGISSLEVVEISDIAYEQFPELLKGAQAVVHLAAPLPGREDVNIMLQHAAEGAINILRQAEAVGVKKFVVTGTVASVTATPNQVPASDKDWNSITKESAIASKSDFDIYSAAKKYAELAIWDWADAHPHVEVTTINPTYCYGPVTDRYPLSPGDYNGLSTILNVYQFIKSNGEFPNEPIYNDVRDVAKAHLGALHSPPSSIVGRKRVVFASPHGFVFDDAVALISAKRPALKDRLITATAPEFSYDRFNVDFDRIEKVTGLKKEKFYSFEQTFLDTVDSLLKIEEEWKAKGYITEKIPTLM